MTRPALLLLALLAGCAGQPRLAYRDIGGWPKTPAAWAWPAWVAVELDDPVVMVGNMTCDVHRLGGGLRLIVPRAWPAGHPDLERLATAETVRVRRAFNEGTATAAYLTVGHVAGTGGVSLGGVHCDPYPLGDGPDAITLLIPRGEPGTVAARPYRGQSGSPVYDSDGRYVGAVYAADSDGEALVRRLELE